MSIKADDLKKAITKKVDKILNNTGVVTDLKITIQGHRGEAPMITYEISEIIVTEKEKKK